MSEQRLKVEAEILKRIDSIRPSNPKKSDYTHGIDVGLAMAKVAIKDAPTIEERKTGRWERHYSRPNVYADLCWHCSVCGYASGDNWANKFNFCPNCGARMVQEGEDNERA